MRISKTTRRAAREAAGNPDLMVWYIEPQQPVVIGYAILPGTTVSELPATDVQITLLDDVPATTTCTLKRSGKSEDLYWIVVQQSRGAVWYRWTAHDGTVHDFLAYADDELETANARQATAMRVKRLQIIWKIVHRTGRPQTVVDQVCQRVGNKLNTALIVFRLIDHLLAAHNDSEPKVREELQELLLRPRDDRHMLYKLRQAGANSTEPSAVVSILHGALRALGRMEQ